MQHWLPKPKRLLDICLMDEAIGYTSNRVCLEKINEVKIATQTLLVSDLFDMEGMKIFPDCYNAKQNLQ